MQDYRLKKIIQHSYSSVPYYRDLFDKANIKPDDIEDRRDLLKIPITTRDALQYIALDSRMARGADINKCLKLRTSGSTGSPLDIFVAKEDHFKSKTWIFLKMYLDNGCLVTDKTLRVVTPAFISKKIWFQYLGILREYFISMFDDMDMQLNTFLKTKPHAIRGYSSGIKSLALRIKESGIKITCPKVIFTTAEVLSKKDRELIFSVFRADIIDYYCCNEVGIIAYECKSHNGYHIVDSNVIIELIKDDGTSCEAGEEGKVVITSLNRRAMPFIRYQIGDIGVAGNRQCPCGKTSFLIAAIKGRDYDQIILPNGKSISSYLLINAITALPGITQFQIVQKALDRINIDIVKNGDFNEDLLIHRLKNECHSFFENGINIKPNIVKEILKDKTGKTKIVKNEISGFRSNILR